MCLCIEFIENQSSVPSENHKSRENIFIYRLLVVVTEQAKLAIFCQVDLKLDLFLNLLGQVFQP